MTGLANLADGNRDFLRMEPSLGKSGLCCIYVVKSVCAHAELLFCLRVSENFAFSLGKLKL